MPDKKSSFVELSSFFSNGENSIFRDIVLQTNMQLDDDLKDFKLGTLVKIALFTVKICEGFSVQPTLFSGMQTLKRP